MNKLKIALDETRQFIDDLHLDSRNSKDWPNLLALIHVIDHMQRLHERCNEDQDRAVTAINTPELVGLVLKLRKAIDLMLNEIEGLNWQESSEIVGQASAEIHQQVQPYRQMIMTKIAESKQDIYSATNCLEAIRWLERVSYHLDHLIWHLNNMRM